MRMSDTFTDWQNPMSPVVDMPPTNWQALEPFSDSFLEHSLVQGQIRHQPAQPDVLLLQLSELADLHSLGNTKRPCLIQWLLPFLFDHPIKPIDTSLRSIPITGLPRYYGLFRPCAPPWYSHSYGSST
jgi:hypothetical protein